MNKKKLAIIGHCDKLNVDLVDGYEILALSIDSIYKFRKSKEKVYSIHEFCLSKNSFEDQISNAQELSSLFSSVDKQLEGDTGIPYSFSANAFWFVHRISSLIALNSILIKITSNYSSVLIYSDWEPQVTHESVNLFSTRFSSLTTSLDFILSSLHMELIKDMHVIVLYNRSTQILQRKLRFILDNLRRIDSIVKKRVLSVSKKITGFTIKKELNVFVAQDGYDVEFIKNEFNKINFVGVDSIKSIISYDGLINKNVNKKANSIVENIFNDFLNKKAPNFKHLATSMFRSYIRDVVLFLPLAERVIEDRIKILNPKAFLFSVGVQSLMGEILTNIAIKNNIPILSFKHSGAGNFFLYESFLEQYSEYQSRTKRYQFIHSSIERDFFKPFPEDIKTIDSRPLITPKYLPGKIRKKRLLYVMGPPSYFGLKELSKTISDRERLNFLEKLLSVCKKFKIPLDIKVHPIGREGSNSLIRMIIESGDDVNILPPGPVENLFNNYDCACFDMLASRSLAQAFTIDIDIIIFVPPNVKTNHSTFEDLYERAMVVRNIKFIDNILKSYYVDRIKCFMNYEWFKSKYIFGDRPKELINRLALFFYG